MKAFRYPPILPIIFYDGSENWTASTKLSQRVLFGDVFWEYIPDYKCILLQLKDYSNADLMKKKDELSILMMIDRLKNAADFSALNEEMDYGYLNEITADSPNYLLNIMVQIIEVFLDKLNIPPEEADMFTEQIKERHMGEFFSQFQGWDVQAIRKQAREESIEKTVHILQAVNVLKEVAQQKLAEQYELSEAEAREKMELYWQ